MGHRSGRLLCSKSSSQTKQRLLAPEPSTRASIGPSTSSRGTSISASRTIVQRRGSPATMAAARLRRPRPVVPRLRHVQRLPARPRDVLAQQDPRGYVNRGAIHLELGLFDAAIADYNKALQLNPKLPGAYYNRGNAYSAAGDNDQYQLGPHCPRSIELTPGTVISSTPAGLSIRCNVATALWTSKIK